MPVTMLMYHMVAAPENAAEARFCRTPEAFRKDMEQIRQAGYQVLSFAAVLDGVSGKIELPDKAVTITFDDGIACAYENALPILQEFGYPASVFIVSKLVGGYNDFAEVFGFPRRRMLTVSEIRTLAESGIDIGSHTVNHIWLGKTDKTIVSKEVEDSKKALEDIVGQEIPHFAYPFGSWNLAARDAVIEAGYRGGCSTISGRNRKGTDPYLLRRSEIKGSDAPWQFRLKLNFATNDMPPVSDVRYRVRQLLKNESNDPACE
ncbi:polysaccharide deacetylase family protein [Nitrosomonas sp. Nm166]|uniref:polysaccharide deacetylase family protein n=1 Tax=Nitrosomonas sp. Nm166 TaxID=1881054 RepID=UPI0008EBE14F|nr:polysaccharide deacetylase family protein [Nitrosomonas sp. Nm166]SFD95277.1 Polysaccharide deacetylase [Nitrosomonas sp. Nm166]